MPGADLRLECMALGVLGCSSGREADTAWPSASSSTRSSRFCTLRRARYAAFEPTGRCMHPQRGGAQLLALLLVDATGGRLLRDFQDRHAFLSPMRARAGRIECIGVTLLPYA